jgi:hypothetical protein
MCECQYTIPKDERLREFAAKTYPKKTFKEAKFRDSAFYIQDHNLGTRMFSVIEVTFEGQKKPGTIEFFHTFCPFCGQKHEVIEGKNVKSNGGV